MNYSTPSGSGICSCVTGGDAEACPRLLNLALSGLSDNLLGVGACNEFTLPASPLAYLHLYPNGPRLITLQKNLAGI